MLVVFIGPPGSGKGTQSQRLTQWLGVPHLSTGEMLREAIEQGTRLGQEAALYIHNGNLAPDEVVIQIVAERLGQPDCAAGCLLDGFPRTLTQASAFDEMLALRGRRLDVAIELRVDDKELVRRLLQRARTSEKPRPDDTPETIPHRLQVYHDDTEPLLHYYRELGLLHSISGAGTPDEVFDRICTVVNDLRAERAGGAQRRAADG